jgi:hypothetical protein
LGQKDLNKIESGSIQGSSSKPFARPEETSSEHLLRCPSSTKAGMRATYAHKGLPGWSLAFALNVARYHKSDVLLHKPTELLPDIIAHRPDASSTQSVVWSAHLSAVVSVHSNKHYDPILAMEREKTRLKPPTR